MENLLHWDVIVGLRSGKSSLINFRALESKFKSSELNHKRDLPCYASSCKCSARVCTISHPNFTGDTQMKNLHPFASQLRITLLATSILAVAHVQSYAASAAPVAAENGMVVSAQHIATQV